VSNELLALIDTLNDRAPGFIRMLGGRITELDAVAQRCRFRFQVSTDFCHSVDIVQGGFITAMLDAAMSHAVFALDQSVAGLSSLEISTRYLDVTRAGELFADGRVLRLSHRTAFLDGELRSADGRLLATSSSVAKISRRKDQ